MATTFPAQSVCAARLARTTFWAATVSLFGPPQCPFKGLLGTSEQQPEINEKLIFWRKKNHSSAAKQATGLRFRIGILPCAVFPEKFYRFVSVYTFFPKNAFLFQIVFGRKTVFGS